MTWDTVDLSDGGERRPVLPARPFATIPLRLHRANRLDYNVCFTVCTENLNPDVVVMKPAKDRL
jgi:hypothetical protein